MPVDVRRIDPKDGNVDPIACIDEFVDLAKFIQGGDLIAPECFEDIARFHTNFIRRTAGFDFDDEKPLALNEAQLTRDVGPQASRFPGHLQVRAEGVSCVGAQVASSGLEETHFAE